MALSVGLKLPACKHEADSCGRTAHLHAAGRSCKNMGLTVWKPCMFSSCYKFLSNFLKSFEVWSEEFKAQELLLIRCEAQELMGSWGQHTFASFALILHLAFVSHEIFEPQHKVMLLWINLQIGIMLLPLSDITFMTMIIVLPRSLKHVHPCSSQVSYSVFKNIDITSAQGALWRKLPGLGSSWIQFSQLITPRWVHLLFARLQNASKALRPIKWPNATSWSTAGSRIRIWSDLQQNNLPKQICPLLTYDSNHQ